jgi:hypothetical protein
VVQFLLGDGAYAISRRLPSTKAKAIASAA